MKFTNNLYSLLLITTLTIISFSSCNKFSNNKSDEDNSEFAKYINAFTSGVISNQSDIIIELNNDFEINKDEIHDLSKILRFTPTIEGSYSWIDENTIRFIPSSKLGNKKIYTADFDIGKIIKMPKDMQTFTFMFESKVMDYRVDVEGIESYGDDLIWNKFNGKVYTSDIVDINLVNEIIEAYQDGKKLKIKWSHENNGLVHNFSIDSVKRMKRRGVLDVSWNGSSISVKRTGSERCEIPPISDFKVMNVSYTQVPSQSVIVRFSDPISKNTDLDGLIYFETNEDIDLSIDKNLVKIYPKNQLNGDKKIKISNSIKNIKGNYLINSFESLVKFTSPKPEIKLIGNGVILPSNNGLIFPFKAINLSSVNVKIIRIYEDNIGQFFQENSFTGSRELTRVGRIIYKDDVLLTSENKIDYSSWNNFALDLSKMIKTEPGAIYRVMISFKKSHSLYPCNDDDFEELEQETDIEDKYFDDTRSYWYSTNNYNYPNRYYPWSEREDPCKLAYYASNKNTIVRNVLASNMGIIAKNSGEGKIKAAITDIRTTDPISGARVELYNLQNKLITSAQTNSEGIASFDVEKKPFFLMVKKGADRGYLKLDDGSSLSMSMFDTDGSYNQKGVKGYLYGDRGVWRPGDSLYISFILEDKNNSLPKNHPVIFKFYNPKNQLSDEITQFNGKNGFYTFKTKTNINDETGNWLAQVKVGDAYFTKYLKIETVKPNRLKINLDFDNDILRNIYSEKVRVSSRWLHGAPASNLKTNIEFTLSEKETRFSDFNGYNFDDYIKRFNSQNIRLKEKVLNDNGEMSFNLPIELEQESPGMLQLSFTTRVFEKGGDASTGRDLIKFSPYRSYVGVKMPKGNTWSGAINSDEKNIIPIATVDEYGNKVNRKVKLEIFEIGWESYWESSNPYEVGRYVTNSSRNLIYSDEFQTNDGSYMYELDLNDNIWGRCYIRITDLTSMHSTGEVFYMTYNGYWSASSVNTEGAEILSFNTDKRKYAVGETVNVSFPEVKKGKALVSIESGADIIKTFWVDLEENNFSFKTTEKMVPNAYLNISLIQPHKNSENDFPIRLYGVKGIAVENPETHLNPIIIMDDELKPESEVSIEIKEKDGRKMTYTIAIVDDGLLDLTNFQTPSPWNTFYAWQSLRVKTWDIYKYVSGSFTGKMAGLLEIGGDEYVKNQDKKRANRFKPVVKFLGPYTIESGKTRKHKFKMPNYVGSVRTMVVAGSDGSYGSTSKTTSVKNPLMTIATLPRVAGPEEVIEMPVNIFVMDDEIDNVNVRIETNDKFEIIGSDRSKLYFDKVSDKILTFKLKVKDKIGVGEVKVVAESGNEESVYNVEMDIRMPNPKISNIVTKTINGNQSWEEKFKTIGIEKTNKGTLEISSIPHINLENRLNGLIQYPHGCIEQTTSSVFPQLYLSKITDLSNDKKKEIQTNVQNGLNKLKSFQTSNGGFTYWPNSNSDANEWGTNYAGHFMLEASSKGYAIPNNLLENWLAYQTKMANNYTPNKYTDLIQAYRLYTLALADKPVLSAMNKLRENINISNIAKWRLAATYQLIGRSDISKELIFNLGNKILDNANIQSNTYGSELRDKAMILETIALMKEYELGENLLRGISADLSSDKYMSTQTAAYCLLAISKFIMNEDSEEMEFTYMINNEEKAIKSDKRIIKIDLDIENRKQGVVQVVNKSDNLIFASIQIEGIPMYNGDPINYENNLKMSVNYTNMDGYPINPTYIKQGTDFIAEVELTHPGVYSDYKDLAVSQIFPSGWEIRNSRMDLVQSSKKDEITYQDVKDDRVYTYLDLKRNETKIFKIKLNASYLGKYYLPIVNCEAMYDNKISSNKGGQWVEVIE